MRADVELDQQLVDAARVLDRAQRTARRAGLDVEEAAAELGTRLELVASHRALREIGSPVLAIPIAANRKLGPVDMVDVGLPRKRPVPRPPFVSVTYVPVQQTCPSTCPFRGHGCMAESGYTGRAVRRLETLAEGLGAYELARLEAAAIDKLCVRGVPRDGGRDGRAPRDLRLHVSGDVTMLAGLRAIVAAVHRWKERGGGSAWSFTHAWRDLPHPEWEPVSVLASVETAEQADDARERGYTPAITVRQFPSRTAFRLRGSDTTWIPCPAETSGRTCATCRLCVDREPWLHESGRGIAFAAHGMGAAAARRRLPVVRTEAA